MRTGARLAVAAAAAPDLLSSRFRANPGYRIVRREQAPEECGPGLYGRLAPLPGAGLARRDLSPDEALLFMTLSEAGPLPIYLVERAGRDLGRIIARLVSDGVLEAEHDGRFLSGPAAREVLLPFAPEEPGGRLATLSRQAVQYAQAMGPAPATVLGRRLYEYGRAPISPFQARSLGDEVAVEAYLGLSEGGCAAARLGADWTPVRGQDAYWRMWRPRLRPSAEGRGTYKLYVSPKVADLPGVFLATIETLTGAPGVKGLKIGRDLAGLTRPDKLVAYFLRLEDLQKAALQLADRVKDAAAQGVPFTAEVAQDGMLSWAMDPPVGSWRLWVAARLATYLSAGDWRHALARLRLDGVDTTTWIAPARYWEVAERRP